jgi:hypothetical protein
MTRVSSNNESAAKVRASQRTSSSETDQHHLRVRIQQQKCASGFYPTLAARWQAITTVFDFAVVSRR